MKKRVKRQHGTSLHASGEDYLEAVLVLQKEKGMVRSVDVARHMGVSKPSVCHAVATLKEGGFLTMDGDFFLRLTDVGREVAEQTYEKHCFFTRLLTEAGVDPKTAEQDACRMEHMISENSFRHLKQSIHILRQQLGVFLQHLVIIGCRDLEVRSDLPVCDGVDLQRLHGIITGLVVSVEIQPATKRLQPETPGVQHIIGLQIVLPLDFLCHFHKTDP